MLYKLQLNSSQPQEVTNKALKMSDLISNLNNQVETLQEIQKNIAELS